MLAHLNPPLPSLAPERTDLNADCFFGRTGERGGELVIDKQMRRDGGGEASGFGLGLGLAHTAIGGMAVGAAGWVGRRRRGIYDAIWTDGASRSDGGERGGAVNFGVRRPLFSSLR